MKVGVDVEIRKTGDGVSRATGELRQLQDSAQQTEQQMQRMAVAVRAVVAAVAGAVFLRDAVRAFEEQEQAVARLNGTLRASGQFTEAYSKELQDLAGNLARVHLASDDAILSVEAQLVSFGAARNEMPKLTEAVLDLATGMRVDVSSAAFAMGKALQGEFGTLGRWGIQVDERAGQAVKMGQVIEDVGTKFRGMGRAAAGTSSGELAQASKAFGELKESIGRVVTAGLAPLAGSLKEAADWAGRKADKSDTLAKSMAGLVKSLAAAGIGLTAYQVLLHRVAVQSALTTSATATLSVQLAGLATGIWAGVEAWKAIRAEMDAVKAVESFQSNLEDRRRHTEKKILQAFNEEQITGEEAAALQKKLAEGFTKFQTKIPMPLILPGFAKMMYRDGPMEISPRKASEALTDVLKVLNPKGYGPKEDATAKEARMRLTLEQIAAEKALFEIRQELVGSSLAGLAKERFAIEENGRKKREEIEAAFAKAGEPGRRGYEEALTAQWMGQAEQERALVDKHAAEQKKTYAEVARFRQELSVEALGGFDKERRAAQVTFERRIEQLREMAEAQKITQAQHEEGTKLAGQARSSEEALIKLHEHEKKYGQAMKEMERFEQQLEATAIQSSEHRVDRANRELESRTALYARLAKQYGLTEKEMTDLMERAALARLEVLASAASEGERDVMRLQARAAYGILAEGTAELGRQYDERRKNIEAFYEMQARRAGENVELLVRLEAEKNERLRQLEDERSLAVNQNLAALGLSYEGIARQVATLGTTAFGSLIQGAKSAGEALREFFSKLFQYFADAIMQALIFRAVMAMFNAFGSRASGVNTFQGGSGITGGPMMARAGGVFGGAILAASGLAGVASVSSPTYLPNFNVMAGEAGSEMLTVLARPRLMDAGGFQAMIGEAAGARLAILNAQDLATMASMPRPMMLRQSGGGEGVSGSAEIVLRLDRQLIAEIQDNSIQGAVLRVENDLHQDSTLSAAVKGLTK